MEGKKIKKPYYYILIIKTNFRAGVLLLWYHTKIPPIVENFESCGTSIIDFQVLICGHFYHEKCFHVLKLKCNHRYTYLSGPIDDLTKSYNERLNMNEDIDDELDLELDSQSDDNDISAADMLKKLIET